MRIVSLIASATEMVCALGLENELVGRSHECDFPPSVKRLGACTAPRFDVEGSSLEIDERVKASLMEGTSVYNVNAELLRQIRPDVILTQGQCEVCAVSEKDVEMAVADWAVKPRIVTLLPNDLKDVWHDLRTVADALGVASRGENLVRQLQGRMNEIAAMAALLPTRPTIACLEWLEPLMAAGNWMPELVAMAGAQTPFGEVGKHSPWMTWEDLKTFDPDVIVALPCGFDLERTQREMPALTKHAEFAKLRAVRRGRIFVADGNQYFNRPGPRLVESLEILAELCHPATFTFGHRGKGWLPY